MYSDIVSSAFEDWESSPDTGESVGGSKRDLPTLLAEGRGVAPINARGSASSLGYYAAIQDSRMSFGFFVETKFIPEHVEHKTISGRTHYQAILKHLLRPETVNRIFNPERMANARLKSVPGWPYLDEVRLCDITPGHVRRLISAAFGRKYSSQTVKHIRNVAFAIISHAQREGCFQGPNPVSQVNLPPMTRKAEHRLSLSQVKTILEIMSYPEREIALLTITTGMNIQEICNLQWKHVNLSPNVRQVDGELIPGMSIAVRTRWNRTGLGDSKRGRKRNIGIAKPLLSILDGLQLRKGNPMPDDFVLESQDGYPIPAAGIRAGRLKPIGRKVGAPWLSWRILGRAQVGALAGLKSPHTVRTKVVLQEGRREHDPLPANADCEKSGTIEPQASIPQISFRPQVAEK